MEQELDGCPVSGEEQTAGIRAIRLGFSGLVYLQ
jgi:hypothetical protein